MLIRFSKMHSLGNDFVLIDAVRQPLRMSAAIASRIADRRRGIGCDQILLAETADNPQSEFAFRIFNADGGEAAQCGNGARCFALFLRRQGLTLADTIRIETHSSRMRLHLLEDDRVKVDMGTPVFLPASIPFDADTNDQSHRFDVGDENLEFDVLSMGNPHAVTLVEEIGAAEVNRIGALMECHPRFPQRTNVGFMQITSRNTIRLRVFERGVGETEACGSGACAAVVSGIRRGLLDADVHVTLPGGDLQVSWRGRQEPVCLTGDAVHVFDGQIEITQT